MARNPIKVMISSRCNDRFPADGPALSELRKDLKRDLEAVTLFGEPLFEVWINEDAPPADTSQDSLDVCLKEVDKADVVLVLSNGNAGWAPNGSDIGICHAELMHAHNTAPGKVRLISLGTIKNVSSDPGEAERNSRFQRYLEAQNFFRGGSVRSIEQAQERARGALVDAVKSLVRLGVREARKGNFHTGDALAWSKLDFAARRRAIVARLREALEDRGASMLRNDCLVLEIEGSKILLKIDAIPAALTNSSARELVGRPFLQDYLLAADLEHAIGPVHIIGCQKGATETQAQNILGFPDATIVQTPFGIYVADPIQKVQFVFLKDCRDPSTTRFAAQRLFDWLEQTGESIALAQRAKSRSKIVKLIAKELKNFE